MRTWAAIFYAIGAVAEVAGIPLVVIEFRAGRAQLRQWDAANPERHARGSYDQMGLVNQVVTGLIGHTRRRAASVVLLVLGVVAGTVGNYLSLYS